MLVSFKDDVKITVRPCPYEAKFYSEIKAILETRLKFLVQSSDQTRDLICCYQQAIYTTEIVKTLHEKFYEKMTGFAKQYRFIKKIPFTHAIIKQEPYGDYIFHAQEYQGGGTFSQRVNNIAEQLCLFINQFIATYQHNIDDVNLLDNIVNWSETLCFDAQVEGRYFNSLVVRYLQSLANHDEGASGDHMREIRRLAAKMDISQRELKAKILQMSNNIGLDANMSRDASFRPVSPTN